MCVCACVCVCVCFTIVNTGCTLAKIKNVKNDVCRVYHLQSNGVIAKIALRDLVYFSKVKDSHRDIPTAAKAQSSMMIEC